MRGCWERSIPDRSPGHAFTAKTKSRAANDEVRADVGRPAMVSRVPAKGAHEGRPYGDVGGRWEAGVPTAGGACLRSQGL